MIDRWIRIHLIALACLVTTSVGVRAAERDPVSGGRPGSPEQLLADTYAPIAMLKRQRKPCDADGEPYVPAPVEIVLGDPAVRLRDRTDGGRILMQAPTAADLAGGDDKRYLDLPGNPRKPGCGYERHFRQRMGDQHPVAYARVFAHGITGQLALQYWLYYAFNDFNNTHESDWEMIQLVFDATSAAEALGEEPVEVVLAQHGGGETADWDEPKLRREGTHPVIYPAAGSHAAYYGNGVYLGWGENGTGFGCDDASGPSVRVPLQARLIPDAPSQDPAFAWTTFRGRWGEKQPWEYNGPTGPITKTQWDKPFAWQAGLRDSSLEVGAAETFGPGPTKVFCSVVGFGALLLTRFQVYPWLVVMTVIAIVAGVLALGWVGGPTLRAATATYAAHWRIFAALGLVLIPIGILANGFQYLVVAYPPGKQLLAVMNKSPGARLAAALTVGGVHQLVGLLVVGPAVVQALAGIEAGRPASVRRTYGAILGKFRRLVVAVVRPLVITAGLALSIVGIPWAVARTVQWLFVTQAVVIDGADPGEATGLSAGVVAGHWWRTAGIAVCLSIVGLVPGPLLGIVLLVWAQRSVQLVNALSSLLYAVALPLSVIGLTLLYRNLSDQRAGDHEPSSDEV